MSEWVTRSPNELFWTAKKFHTSSGPEVLGHLCHSGPCELFHAMSIFMSCLCKMLFKHLHKCIFGPHLLKLFCQCLQECMLQGPLLQWPDCSPSWFINRPPLPQDTSGFTNKYVYFVPTSLCQFQWHQTYVQVLCLLFVPKEFKTQRVPNGIANNFAFILEA